MFALQHKETKKLAGFSANSNDGSDFCSAVEFSIEKGEHTKNVWVVDSRDVAEHAANNSPEWYNAGFKTPTNEYIGEWDVVELTVK